MTYQILESTVKRSFSDTEITEAKKMLWARFPAEEPNESKIERGKWIDRHKLELQIEDIYKRLVFLGNNSTLPQDCVCVSWSDIESLPEYLSDEAFELRAESKVGNEAVNERFQKLEKQNVDIFQMLTELKTTIKNAAKPVLGLPNDRVADLWEEGVRSCR